MIDLNRRHFGKLIVIQRMDNNKWGQTRWLCKCNCGNEKIISGYHLKSSHTKSCGCLAKKGNNMKHGHSKKGKETKIYKSWQGMKQRCTNSNNKYYHNYGGRGITICEEWLSFPNFQKDMERGWKPGLTLERKNNELGYNKENCEWATHEKQNRNKRNNRYIIYKRKRWLFVELCKEHNMPYMIVRNRIYRYGWSIKEALTIPVRQCRKGFK